MKTWMIGLVASGLVCSTTVVFGKDIATIDAPFTKLPKNSELIFPNDFQIQIPKGVQISTSDEAVLFGYRKGLIGPSKEFLNLSTPLLQTDAENFVKTLTGDKKPSSGMYCFSNLHKNGKTSVQDRQIRFSKQTLKIGKCEVTQAADKIVSNGIRQQTTTTSFRFLSATNDIFLHLCSVSDENNANSVIGCVGYHTSDEPTLNDFLKSFGLTTKTATVTPDKMEVVVKDHDFPEVPQVKVPSQAEVQASQAKSREIAARLEKSESVFQAGLQALPKYNDPEVIKLAGKFPIVKKLHEDCAKDLIFQSADIAVKGEEAKLLASCEQFKLYWEHRKDSDWTPVPQSPDKTGMDQPQEERISSGAAS